MQCVLGNRSQLGIRKCYVTDLQIYERTSDTSLMTRDPTKQIESDVTRIRARELPMANASATALAEPLAGSLSCDSDGRHAMQKSKSHTGITRAVIVGISVPQRSNLACR